MASVDTVIGIIGDVVGVVGLGAAVFAILDARRQRSARDKAVLAARSVIDRTYGTLIGIKAAVKQAAPYVEPAINDGLAAINAARSKIDEVF